QTVSVAVITTFKLHQLGATADTAREPDSRHRSLGAAAHHAHHLDRRHSVDHFLREIDFQFRRSAKTRTFRSHFLDSSDDLFIGMAQNHRTQGTDVIDVSSPIDVGDSRALSGTDESRSPADAAKRAHRRIHTAGYQILRSGE